MNTVETRTDAAQELYATLDALPAIGPPHGMPVYAAQYMELENLSNRAKSDPSLTPMLLDYAARPGGAQLIRSYALDIGVSASLNAQRAGCATAEQQEVCRQVLRVAPELADTSREPWNAIYYEDPALPLYYFWYFRQLATAESIDDRLVVPDPYDLGCDPTTVRTNVPAVAGVLLSRLVGAAEVGDINNLSPQVSRDALELALNFRSNDYQQSVVEGNYAVVAEFGRLGRLTKAGGFEHDAPIDFLYQLPDSERLDYARTFNRLYDIQTKLTDFFPDDDVVLAAQALLANTLFAVEGHVRSGMQTDVTIRLRRAGEVHDSFTGDEPLLLLKKLADKLERAHRRITDPRVRPKVAVHQDDFTLFDFPAPDDDPLLVTHYIREEGGHTCDYRYEYGGRRPGVLAAKDWRLDEGLAKSPRPFHKSSRTLEAFSIRLDREVPIAVDGTRDPNNEKGAVSLDVGSLMGTGFSRKIALFVAFGNMRRAAAAGVEASFNHQTDKIDPSEGRASVFAAKARARRQALLAQAGHADAVALRVAALTATALELAS